MNPSFILCIQLNKVEAVIIQQHSYIGQFKEHKNLVSVDLMGLLPTFCGLITQLLFIINVFSKYFKSLLVS